jgi:predicted small lipoprotein YifL
MKNLYRMLMILAALVVSTFAEAACGDRGGPGYRGPDGKCLSWQDPRARKRERRTDLAVKQAYYRLADEKRARSYLSRAANAIGGLRFHATSYRLAWRGLRAAQPECNAQRTVVEGTRR